MSGFVVQGPKSDYRDSSGLKNRLYPKKKKEQESDKPTCAGAQFHIDLIRSPLARATSLTQPVLQRVPEGTCAIDIQT